MSILPRFGGSALKYWGTILTAAYQNLNNSDMWTAIHRQAANYGLPSPQTQPPDASVIRGFANRIANGARTLAGASNSDSILPTMMGYAPYTSRDQASIDTAPVYSVRYQMVYQDANGDVQTKWSQSIYTNANFPAKVGDLRVSIRTNAEEMVAQMAQKTGGASGGTLLGTGSLEISLV